MAIYSTKRIDIFFLLLTPISSMLFSVCINIYDVVVAFVVVVVVVVVVVCPP